MEKKKFKMGLVPKLILAIIIGILFGQFLPEGFCRLVVTLSGFFSNFLKFIIPLMILAYVTMGIADLSRWKTASDHRCPCIQLYPDRRLRILPGCRKPVPELYERRCIRPDRCYRRSIPVSVLYHHHPASHGHSVRSCACLCFRTLPVFHARQGDRRYPLQCNQGFFFYY